MNENQIHRAVSRDGTEIAGRVVGQGPALVLVHAGLGDGELERMAALAAQSVHHVAKHVANPQVREVSGAGHMGAWATPEPVAKELTRFFEASRALS